MLVSEAKEIKAERHKQKYLMTNRFYSLDGNLWNKTAGPRGWSGDEGGGFELVWGWVLITLVILWCIEMWEWMPELLKYKRPVNVQITFTGCLIVVRSVADGLDDWNGCWVVWADLLGGVWWWWVELLCWWVAFMDFMMDCRWFWLFQTLFAGLCLLSAVVTGRL